ncbi:PREDICTED: CDK5 and ABL1 enzyme substrate 1-like [Nanorana parkeri]|uniref:CDK5 and ABL1 enzyme substrate 1-like n=1 Tax=Nanorana parkeri TaxID=125878 RepID=UPI0008542C82|nr:PREDICTED: CDK5 and ABL1 enzyme substrate 1-like [Nanorana parkeri]
MACPMQSPAAHSLDHARSPQLMDPRRRQAALSFLTNISLDGRPLQDRCGAQDGNAGAAGWTVRALQCEDTERSPGAGTPGTPGRQLHGKAIRASPQLVSSRCRAAVLREDEEHELHVLGKQLDEAEDENRTPAIPITPLSAGTRGRLNSFTYGILPASFTRTCAEPIQGAICSAIDNQRSSPLAASCPAPAVLWPPPVPRLRSSGRLLSPACGPLAASCPPPAVLCRCFSIVQKCILVVFGMCSFPRFQR